MEYLLIIILQLLGVGFHVGQKVKELDAKFSDDSLSDVMKEFWKQDRITLFLSVFVLASNLVAHFIVENYAPGIRAIDSYALYSFALAFVLGYAGQRLIYKSLGKAEEALNKKIDNKIG